MNTRSRMAFESGSTVWVWDSTWLPAIVVNYGVDWVRVRLAHGVTFNVDAEKLVARDSVGGGKDAPRACWRDEGVIHKQMMGSADLAHYEGKQAPTKVKPKSISINGK
ncbi:MAG: hypothetical protein JO121_27425 [Deltaproteobacteria bacterium]|nr:hypothetical protein [Deltaproteobacteria bacterium]